MEYIHQQPFERKQCCRILSICATVNINQLFIPLPALPHERTDKLLAFNCSELEGQKQLQHIATSCNIFPLCIIAFTQKPGKTINTSRVSVGRASDPIDWMNRRLRLKKMMASPLVFLYLGWDVNMWGLSNNTTYEDHS